MSRGECINYSYFSPCYFSFLRIFFWEPLYFRKCLVHCRDDHLNNVCVIFRRLCHLYRAGFRGYSSKYQEAFGIFWVLILYGV